MTLNETAARNAYGQSSHKMLFDEYKEAVRKGYPILLQRLKEEANGIFVTPMLSDEDFKCFEIASEYHYEIEISLIN
ncbi:MAG: hypothetical protein QM642_03305 [Edaphocola sp.]